VADERPIRVATPEDALAVRRVLDAAVLAYDDLDERIGRGDVLVAVPDGRVVGACVLDPERVGAGAHVDAIAVVQSRRGQGVGRALIEAALDREGRLTAAFDPDVRPFYAALDFSIAERDGRLWGEREA